MPSFASIAALAALPALTFAAPHPVKRASSAQVFSPPAGSPFEQSANYAGKNNGTYPKGKVVPGKSFDRFIQIWLENTDYQVVASTPEFQQLAKDGQVLNSYYAVTHPSEPNYIAAAFGDFFGLSDDGFNAIPENITTVMDLLDDGGASGGNISWACYEENMPYDGFTGINYTSTNYITPGAAPYTYYERKHNPCIISNSGARRPERVRNFNDFAADVNASVLPQWMFVTPNMVNDGHDTSAAFFSNWTNWWLTPLLNDTRFNDNRTLVLLTFDENESYGDENRVFSVLLGGALPSSAKGTEDSTYYTHYSAISTVEANWQLKNLGRGDVNTTMSNVFSLVANATGYKNVDVPEAQRPMTNLTGVAPGPLNPDAWIPFTAPANQSATGAGGQGILLVNGINKTYTPQNAPAAVNLTTMGMKVPYTTDPNINNAAASSGSGSGSSGQKDAAGSVDLVLAGRAAVSVALLAAGSALLL